MGEGGGSSAPLAQTPGGTFEQGLEPSWRPTAPVPPGEGGEGAAPSASSRAGAEVATARLGGGISRKNPPSRASAVQKPWAVIEPDRGAEGELPGPSAPRRRRMIDLPTAWSADQRYFPSKKRAEGFGPLATESSTDSASSSAGARGASRVDGEEAAAVDGQPHRMGARQRDALPDGEPRGPAPQLHRPRPSNRPPKGYPRPGQGPYVAVGSACSCLRTALARAATRPPGPPARPTTATKSGAAARIRPAAAPSAGAAGRGRRRALRSSAAASVPRCGPP